MFQEPSTNKSIAANLKGKTMTGDGQKDNDHLPLNGEDPPLRMTFHDPLSAAKRPRQAASAAAAPLPNKRPKLAASYCTTNANNSNEEDKSSLLHQSCRLFPKCAVVLQNALEMEPEAATQRAARRGNSHTYTVGDGREPYSLPINILLHHDASLDVLQLVAKAAPLAVALKDGRDECCSLNIALRKYGRANRKNEDEDEEDETPSPPTIPEELLSANNDAAQVPDKRRNFPLHVAVYVGASFTVINKFYYAYPGALLETNFYGETPLTIAIRNCKCSDLTTNFLQEKMDHLKTARLRSMRK